MKIAFTSCMDATRVARQPVWARILEQDPDVLLLLGDQIYMDWGLGRPKWRQYILDKGDEALLAFAVDMHMRYQAQAQVPEFLALLRHMVRLARPVLLTWDDHDFAWNNSEGVSTDEPGDTHSVPAQVKAISYALFRQFEAFTANPEGHYPALQEAADGPPHRWRMPASGIQSFHVLAGENGPVPLAMLDTRWYRTARKFGSRTVLGVAQRAELMERAARSEGLLLVAAGSPIKHNYLSAEQDWVGRPGDPQDSYVEYEELLSRARRPLLYLSGDIHRVCWGGRVNSMATRKSQVVQAMASPAGIAGIGPKKFAPGFGVLTLSGTAQAGHIKLALHALDREGLLLADALTKTAAFTAGAWQDNGLDGEAAQDDPFLAGTVADRSPLAALIALARRGGTANQTLAAPLEETGAIDSAYKEAPPPLGWPEPVRVKVEQQGPRNLETLVFAPSGDLDVPNARQTLMDELIAAAFEQALDRDRKSVVFYLHGLGKSPTAAIDQGYALRESYNCEPIVFCWPSGWSEGALGRYFDVFNAARMGTKVLEALGHAIGTFADLALHPRFAGLAKVIVARSAGAALLDAVLEEGALTSRLFGVDRILLSSAGIEARRFHRPHGNAFADPRLANIVVTINGDDSTLKLAKWFTQPGPALGLADPLAGERHAHVTYLDFTRSEGVGRLHDYLLPDINAQQNALNRLLLTRKAPLEPSAISQLEPTTAGNVFLVR